MGDPGTRQSNRSFQPDSDVHITWEDQGKINQFARCNAKNDDIKAELRAKQNQLQNLKDASDELELLDYDSQIPFQCGEIFVYMNMEETVKALDNSKEKLLSEIDDLKVVKSELEGNMSKLKVDLYAKLGNRINLEDEE